MGKIGIQIYGFEGSWGLKFKIFPMAGRALSFVSEGFNPHFHVILWNFDGFGGSLDGIWLEQNRGLNEAKIAFQLSFGLAFSIVRSEPSRVVVVLLD